MLRKMYLSVIVLAIIFSVTNAVFAQEFPLDEEINFGSGIYVVADMEYRLEHGNTDIHSVRLAGEIKISLDGTMRTVEPHGKWNTPGYFWTFTIDPACPLYSSVSGDMCETTNKLVVDSVYSDKAPIALKLVWGNGSIENPFVLEIIFGDAPAPTPEPVPAPNSEPTPEPTPAPTPASDVKVDLNGQILNFDQPPIIVDGRTLVPLRGIFEAMGATVDWHQDTQTVTSSLEGVEISLGIGSDTLYRDGDPVKLDVPAQVVNNRTLVPVRAIAEAYGAYVDWDDATKTVIINY